MAVGALDRVRRPQAAPRPRGPVRRFVRPPLDSAGAAPARTVPAAESRRRMSPGHDPKDVVWRLHLRSPTSVVYRMLATDEGRTRFWAESAVEAGGVIHFKFPNGRSWRGRVLERTAPHLFAVEYLGGSVATFRLEDDGRGGTDLTLTDRGVPEGELAEATAGWASVLLALKAAVDFGVDLRNHDAARTWDFGFVDN